ncbi:MAG: hypothetical protein VX501_07295 [Pseudomonadota bacterium]|nr:hypothetical protein [Pseudomonadota bacterium]
MSNETLENLFAMDDVPAFDPAFRAGVMRAVARRRFLVELAVLACASVVLLIVLLASGDALATAAAQMLSSLDTAGATLVIAGGVAFLGHALVTRAISLPRRVFS